jgi:hypothetical protein
MPVVVDVSAERRVRQFMADDELAVVLCLVADGLELRELGRLMRTCRLAWAALSADNVWQAVHARHASGDTEEAETPTTGLSWKERTRRLTKGVKLNGHVPEGTVLVYGVWLVVTTKYATLFLSQRYITARDKVSQPAEDEVTEVEFVMDSNGWFRARVGQESWVFWSQVNRSHQDLVDG